MIPALPFAPDAVVDLATVIRVPSAPWNGAKPGHCHDNVLEMIRRHGGTQVFGWALAEFGPLSATGSYAPPLYRRWVNHVVWRDVRGQLWEVSPCVTVEDQELVTFQETQFVADPSATVGRATTKEWFETGTRYVAVCQEGIEAARYLTLAQVAASHHEMVNAIQNAVNAVGSIGYQPAKVVVQNIAGHTTSIWLYADFVDSRTFQLPAGEMVIPSPQIERRVSSLAISATH